MRFMGCTQALLTYVWLMVDTFQALQKIELNVMKCKQQETIYTQTQNVFVNCATNCIFFAVVVILVAFSFHFFHSFYQFAVSLFLSSVLFCNRKKLSIFFFGGAHLNNQFVTIFCTTQLKMQLAFCHRQPKKPDE